MAFNFENLKVYRDALGWVESTHRSLHELNRHCPKSIRDQLARAALSIPLNIAEGNGRWHKAEKRQFYWVARGSVFECVAIVQVMARMGLLRDDVVTEYYEQLSELSKMLTALIRSVDALKDKVSNSQSTSAIA